MVYAPERRNVSATLKALRRGIEGHIDWHPFVVYEVGIHPSRRHIPQVNP